ncbi:MAG: hypothetical protein LBS40_07705, partial [Burkholderiales bacterium]|nr:hypothetical protein [Burkholderiales bacterium]
MKRSESANNLAKHHRKCGSRRGYLLPAFISALATLIFCVGVTAQAATITVNSSAGTLTDSGKCTLRGAIGSINSGSNQNNCVAVVSPDAYGINDTITFDTTVFSAATTIMVSPEITITKSLTIDGALDGNGDPL